MPKINVKRLFDSPKTRVECELSGCKNFSRMSVADETHILAEDWGYYDYDDDYAYDDEGWGDYFD